MMLTREDLLNEQKNQNTNLFQDTVDAFQAGVARSGAGMASFFGMDNLSGSLQEIADSQIRTMTPESQIAMGKRLINEDMSLGEGATDGRTWLLNIAQVTGDLATTALPGGALGKGVSFAGRAMKAGEGVAKVAGATSMGTMVATNISSAGGQAGIAARDDIMNLSYEDLADSPVFQELAVSYHKKGMSQEDALSKAQEDIADEVKNRITYDPTMMTINGTLGVLGDKAITKVVSGKLGKTIKGAIGKAIVAEGGTEGVQGAAQRYTQNVESNKAAGTQLYDPMQNVGQEAAEGAILGAVVGGGAGGVGGTVGNYRRRSFQKKVETFITPQAITDAKAAGMTDGEIRKNFENAITNAALERGFEVEDAEIMATNAVKSAFGEGPTADQRAQMEDIQAEQQQEASQPQQQPKQQPEKPTQTMRYQSNSEGALHNDANNLIKELQSRRKQARKDGDKDLENQIGQDMSRLMSGRDRIVKNITDNEGNVIEPKFDEEGRNAYLNTLRRTAENYFPEQLQQQEPVQAQEQTPQQKQMFNPETGEVIERAPAEQQEVEPTLSQEDIYGQLGLPSDYQPTEAAQRVRQETGTDLQQELANQEQISKPEPNIRREREMLAPTEAAQRVRSQLPEFEAEAQRRQQAEESQLTAEQEAENQRERDLNRGFEAQQSFNKEGQKATNQAKQSQVEPTRQIEQSTVYQPRQQEREQVRYEEPAPTAEEIINRNRGKRAGVLKGNLGESMPAKRNKRQVKKAKSKLKAAQQTIYDRITKSDPLATNQVEQDFAATTGYTPNSAMMEAFEALKPTKKEPTPEEVEQRVDELQEAGAVEKPDADAIRLQARRDFINEYELPDDAPIWMQQDQDNIDKLKDAQVNKLYEAIREQEAAQWKVETQEEQPKPPAPIAEQTPEEKTLTVRFADKEYPVTSLEDAKQKWNQFINETGAGASEVGSGIGVYNENGDVVGRITYNGRMWTPTKANPNFGELSDWKPYGETKEESAKFEPKAEEVKKPSAKPIKLGESIKSDVKRLSNYEVNIYPYDEASGLRGKPYRIEQQRDKNRIVMFDINGKVKNTWHYGGDNGTLRAAKEAANEAASKENELQLKVAKIDKDRAESNKTAERKAFNSEWDNMKESDRRELLKQALPDNSSKLNLATSRLKGAQLELAEYNKLEPAFAKFVSPELKKDINKILDTELKELWNETPEGDQLSFDRLTNYRKRFNKVLDGEGTASDVAWVKEWVNESAKGQTAPAKAEAVKPIAKERFAKLKTGKSDNPRYQSYLDTLEQKELDNLNSNAGFMGWISANRREFMRANDIKNDRLSPEQDKAFDAYLREQADANLSDRVEKQRGPSEKAPAAKKAAKPKAGGTKPMTKVMSNAIKRKLGKITTAEDKLQKAEEALDKANVLSSTERSGADKNNPKVIAAQKRFDKAQADTDKAIGELGELYNRYLDDQNGDKKEWDKLIESEKGHLEEFDSQMMDEDYRPNREEAEPTKSFEEIRTELDNAKTAIEFDEVYESNQAALSAGTITEDQYNQIDTGRILRMKSEGLAGLDRAETLKYLAKTNYQKMLDMVDVPNGTNDTEYLKVMRDLRANLINMEVPLSTVEQITNGLDSKHISSRQDALKKVASILGNNEPTPPEGPKGTKKGGYTRTQTAPRGNEKSKPQSLKGYKAQIEDVSEGKASRDDMIELAKNFRDDHDVMIAELNSMTMPKIKEMMGQYWSMMHKDYNKANLVEAAWGDLMKNFLFAITADHFISTSGQRGKELGDYVIGKLEAVSVDDYNAVQAKKAEKAKAEAAEAKRRKEALDNPITLQDFVAYARDKGEGIESFTPEQLKRYDELMTEQQVLKLKERQQKAAEIRAVDGEVSYQLAETVHTKLNEPRYVVQLTGERMGKEAFKDLAARARQLGGNFVNAMQAKRYNTIDGFQFANVEDRNTFAQLLDGEQVSSERRQAEKLESKQDSRVTKLKEMADKLEADANEEINRPRKTNTAKRSREAASAMDSAYSNQHDARLMRGIAEATEAGKVELLGNLSQRVQLDELLRARGAITWNLPEDKREQFAYRNEQGNWKLKPETKLDDILYWVKYPAPEARVETLHRIADAMEGVKGFKQAANKIRSNTKTLNSSDNAVLKGRQWETATSKIREFARKNKDEYVAQWLNELFLREDRLNRMGINGPAALRNTLRELSSIEKTISSDRPVETPVTKLEREITETIQNNRNAFNDFFPTDNDALSDHVVELADIQPEHKVLEPSAGMGHLADKIKAKGADLEVGELAYKMQNLLEEKGHKVVAGDFLDYNPGPIYDRIVMNPPFSNDADVKHVTHAISMLKPGGRLVAITGAMAGDKSNSANKNLREYLDSVGAVEERNPENSFKNSMNSTGVSTKTIVIDKPEDPANLPVPDDIRFSQSSVVTEPVKGMNATAVETEAQKWLDNYDGLKAANIQVVEKQSDLNQWVETDPGAKVKGVWLSGDNRVVLVAENMGSLADVRSTLRHELIAHNGLYGNLTIDERTALTDKVMKLRNNAKLKSVFNEVDNSYKNVPDDVKAEEVIARIAEAKTGKVRQVADRVMAMVMGALRRSGVLSQEKITISEIRNMINGVDKYLRRNDGTLSLPNAVRFSQRVDKVQGLDQSYEAILEGNQQNFMQKVLSKTLDKSKVRDALKSGGWNFLTLRQTADVAAKKVSKQFASHIDNYMGEMNQMTADEGRATQDILSTFEGLDKWRRKNKAESDRVFNLMHDLTLENVDPTQDYTDMTPELEKAKASLQAQIKSRSGEANAKKFQEIKEIEQQIKNEPRREKIHERRRKEFLALPKESQDVIKKISDHYTKQREDVTNALMEKAADLAMDGGKIGKAMMLKIRLDNEIAKKGFYVPLARFGDYFIDGINENGERVFTMYQTQAEMDRAFDRLHAAGYEVKKGKTTEQRAGLDSVSASFVTKMTQELETTTMSEKARDELKDRVYQLYLDTLPTRSIRKQFIHRKGVAGFSKDALQALADQGAKQAKQLSRLKHEDKMQQQLDALNKEYEDLKSRPEGSEDRVSAARIMDSMSKRHEWVMNPQRAAWASKMTGFGFFWLIGASPASALINVTQNVQVALPVIGAKYGVAKTGQVMAGLTGEFLKNFKAAHADMETRRKHGILGSTILKGDELKAMEEAIAMGVIDTTQTHDLIGLAENQTNEITDTTAKVMRGIGWMFHHAEVLNREVTFMTAYRMAKNAGESHAAAKDYAVKATWDSHFDYGSLNRAKFMQGDVASVALQFKQYSQNMTFYLVHNFLQAFALKNPVTGTFFSTVSKNTTPEERAMARKQLMGTMAATFLIGGLGAMPVATLAAIANMAHAIVGDDDEPWDAETELKGIMAEWFGDELADGMYYGLGTMVGLPNISSRVEIDPKSMWFRDSYSMNSQGAFKEQALNALGPVFSIAQGAAKGFDYIFREQKYQQGFESIAPKWVRDVSKTARYLGEGGEITNRQGDVIVADLSPLEYAEQLLGFTPSRQVVQGAKNRAYKDYERQVMDRRKLLMNAMWQTFRTNDVEGMKNVWKRIDKFNQSEWGRLNPITRKTVNQSMRIRARGQSKAKNGIRINDKYVSQLNAMQAAN